MNDRPSMYVIGGLLPVSFFAITFVRNASALSRDTSLLHDHNTGYAKIPIVARDNVLSFRINQQQRADHFLYMYLGRSEMIIQLKNTSILLIKGINSDIRMIQPLQVSSARLLTTIYNPQVILPFLNHTPLSKVDEIKQQRRDRGERGWIQEY